MRKVTVDCTICGSFRTVQVGLMLFLSTTSLPHLNSFVQMNLKAKVTKLQQLLTPRGGVSLAGCADFIMATGGISSYKYVKKSEEFCLSKAKWRGRCPMVKADAYQGSVIIDKNKVYNFGGINAAFFRVQEYS